MLRLLFAQLLALISLSGLAAEGMWPLDELPLGRLKQDYDFKPDSELLQQMQLGTLRLSGGCSGSFVSPQGLVLTNHHCVSRCLAQLSGSDNNLFEQGFQAETLADEAICPQLEAQQLQSISDVTASIDAASKDLSAAQASSARAAAKSALQEACEDGNWQIRCEIVSLHHGAQHKLYKYQRFQDVRLAFAPESQIARFGGSTGSAKFPRYALDFSLLRIYQQQKPYSSDHYFRASTQGPQPDELLLVTGHPGSSQRDLSVAQLETLRDVILPQRLAYLSQLSGVLRAYNEALEPTPNLSQRELMSIENSLNTFRGRLAALSDPEFMLSQQAQEAELRHQIKKNAKLRKLVGEAFADLQASQQSWREQYTEYTMLERLQGYQSDLISMARHLIRAAEQRAQFDQERLPEYREAALPQITQRLFSAVPIDYELEQLTLSWSLNQLKQQLGEGHPAVQVSLAKTEPAEIALSLITQTRLGDPAVRKQLWEGGQTAILASQDPLITFVRMLEPFARSSRHRYETEVAAVVEQAQAKIRQARHALEDTNSYPEASFSLRLSYGQLQGFNQQQQHIDALTRLGGIIARASDADPFQLPASWDGRVNDVPLELPLNFVSDHDILGGNSGSPVFSRDGHLRGLVFDGNQAAMGGIYAYHAATNRAIAVHPASIHFALDTIYAAKRLDQEMFGTQDDETPSRTDL